MVSGVDILRTRSSQRIPTVLHTQYHVRLFTVMILSLFLYLSWLRLYPVWTLQCFCLCLCVSFSRCCSKILLSVCWLDFVFYLFLLLIFVGFVRLRFYLCLVACLSVCLFISKTSVAKVPNYSKKSWAYFDEFFDGWVWCKEQFLDFCDAILPVTIQLLWSFCLWFVIVVTALHVIWDSNRWIYGNYVDGCFAVANSELCNSFPVHLRQTDINLEQFK